MSKARHRNLRRAPQPTAQRLNAASYVDPQQLLRKQAAAHDGFLNTVNAVGYILSRKYAGVNTVAKRSASASSKYVGRSASCRRF
jgi:hypothetical protein